MLPTDRPFTTTRYQKRCYTEATADIADKENAFEIKLGS